MAWSTFPTLTDGQILTGAHMQVVRDNFAETAPAKATTAGSFFVSTGANVIAERLTGSAVVSTSEATTSSSYTNLTTPGPAVTVTTGVRALVVFGAWITNDTAGSRVFMSYAVSGATTVAAADASAMAHDASSTNRIVGASRVIMQGLTAGSNTFTAQYKVSANTGTFSQRNLAVVPF